MPRPISATISVSALTHNLATVRRHLDQTAAAAQGLPPSIWAVIKANAYGHGIEQAVAGSPRRRGWRCWTWTRRRCREAGWGGPILLLEGFFEPADLDIVDRYHLSTSVHHREQLDMLARARLSRKVDIMLKLNSGMNRLGFSPAAYPAAFERAQLLQQQGVLGSVGKMTHFACADGPQGVNEQLGLFNSVTHRFPARSASAIPPPRCASRKSPSVPRRRRTGCGRASACTAPRPSPTRTRPPSACGLPSRCVPRSSRCRNSRPAIRSATAPFSARARHAHRRRGCGYADGYPGTPHRHARHGGRRAHCWLGGCPWTC